MSTQKHATCGGERKISQAWLDSPLLTDSKLGKVHSVLEFRARKALGKLRKRSGPDLQPQVPVCVPLGPRPVQHAHTHGMDTDVADEHGKGMEVTLQARTG